MKKDKSTTLLALTAAAVMLPGISPKANANPMDPATTFDYKFSNYEEGKQATDKIKKSPRYSIDAHQFKFKTPVLTDAEVGFTAVHESMSGASPWYIQAVDYVDEANPNQIKTKAVVAMSGATIDEERNEIGASFRSFNKELNSETTFSAGYSEENDYRSLSFGFSGAFYVNQQLTTLEYGVNTSKDYIDATDPNKEKVDYLVRPTNEMKNRLGLFVGGSHILTKNTLIGTTLSYALVDGYLSDPYKQAWIVSESVKVKDSRPYWNEQFALTLTLREFFPKADGALHVDYRFYTSTWKLDSNTLELAWYQNLGDGWQLIPSVRLYDQSQAQFYAPYYATRRSDGYYSSDYRLSDFSATSGQLKVQKTFDAYKASLSYEKYDSSGDNPALVSYDFISLGISTKF